MRAAIVVLCASGALAQPLSDAPDAGPDASPTGDSDAGALSSDDLGGGGASVEALFVLEEELNRETTVASTKAQALRETPGIVTALTREEIVESGARDLLDVLKLVPGFWIGSDVQGVVGMGFRGVWGYEGKILLLIDGHEQNELLFSTVQLGNHYPADIIQRVEIIRGPGSARYGGQAELAVINVVTRTAKNLNGVSASITGGLMTPEGSAAPSAFGRANAVVSGAHTFANGLEAWATVSVGRGQRSTRSYTDFAGRSYSLNGNAELNPAMVSLGVDFQGFSARFMGDWYSTTERDSYVDANARALPQTFTSYLSQLSYERKFFDKLTVTARLSWSHQLPWRVLTHHLPPAEGETEDYEVPEYADYTTDRFTARLMGSYDILENLNVALGLEGRRDSAKLNDLTNLGGSQAEFYVSPTQTAPSIAYYALAPFGEVLWETFLGNFLAGARFEAHSAYASAFVPRFAYTKRLWKFHVKALFSQAYRAPAIANINYSNQETRLQPELLTAAELEVGFQPLDWLVLSVNAFDLTIDRPIVFRFDVDSGEQLYGNYARTGSRGVEAEVKVRHALGWANLTWSFASAANKNQIDLYEVPGRTDQMIAMPQHKVTANVGIKPWRGLRINPSLVAVTERFGYTHADADGNPVVQRFPAVFLVNLFVGYSNVGLKGLDVSLGVNNLFNSELVYIQGYNGGKPPLPGPTREVLLRVAYTWDVR